MKTPISLHSFEAALKHLYAAWERMKQGAGARVRALFRVALETLNARRLVLE
jgi:hypothetical protein